MSRKTYMGAIKNVNLDRIKKIDSVKKVKQILCTYNKSICNLKEEENYLFAGDVADRPINQVGDIIYDEKYGITRPPVFLDGKVNATITNENALFILPKESLLLLIKAYQKSVADYFRSVIEGTKDLEKNTESNYDGQTITDFISQKEREWSEVYLVVDENENNNDIIVSSRSYEYGIFNLIHLYKTFDFKNETLLIYSF